MPTDKKAPKKTHKPVRKKQAAKHKKPTPPHPQKAKNMVSPIMVFLFVFIVVMGIALAIISTLR